MRIKKAPSGSFIKAALFVMLLTSFSSFGQDVDKPNILFIMGDDLNTCQGIYGSICKTPNIDRLASQGAIFDRAYTQFPLCGPARASIFSGMYASTLGLKVNTFDLEKQAPYVKMLPDVLKENGYWTGRISKVYHMGIPGGIIRGSWWSKDDWGKPWSEQVFVKSKEYESSGVKSRNSGHVGGQGFYTVEVPDSEAHLQADAKAAAVAIRMIEQHKNEPFFIAVGFVRPHVPLVAPEKYFKMYPLENIPVPEDLTKAQLKAMNPLHRSQANQNKYKMTTLHKKKAIQAYYASVSFIDEQVGKLLQALKDNGLEDNTIVIFTSDHGYNLGHGGMWQKLSLNEGSARVPLIISGPGIKKARHKQLVELIDLYPTICSLSKTPIPDIVQGQDLSALLHNPSITLEKQDVYAISVDDAKALITSRYKLIKVKNMSELYDLKKDPEEKYNHYKNPEYKEIRTSLEKRLQQAQSADKSKGKRY